MSRTLGPNYLYLRWCYAVGKLASLSPEGLDMSADEGFPSEFLFTWIWWLRTTSFLPWKYIRANFEWHLTQIMENSFLQRKDLSHFSLDILDSTMLGGQLESLENRNIWKIGANINQLLKHIENDDGVFFYTKTILYLKQGPWVKPSLTICPITASCHLGWWLASTSSTYWLVVRSSNL